MRSSQNPPNLHLQSRSSAPPLDDRPSSRYPYFGVWRNTEGAITNEVFRALSDPTRRDILRFLRDREHTAGELAERFPLAKSTLSGHFNVLKAADLIEQEKRGTTIYYRLNATVFQEMLLHLLELFGAGGEGEGRSSGAGTRPSSTTGTRPSSTKGEG